MIDAILAGTDCEPRKGQLCSWVEALIIGGITGAALGTTAAGVNSLVHGVYPWEDPIKYFTADLKGGAIGGVTGAATSGLGSALGPALGSAADAVGIGSNLGTEAVEAGAATPTALGGVVPASAGHVIAQAGEQATQATVGNVAKQALQNAIGGSATGALGNMDNPGRGALMGAASGAASAGFNGIASGLGHAIQGDPGLTPNAMDGASRGFTMNNPSGDFSYQPNAHAGFSLGGTSATPLPSLGQRLGGQAVGMGGRLAGGAASNMVGSALTPRPTTYNPNPYAQYGIQPYWARTRLL